MAASQDTEITLGTGKMLVMFFGLVALCAVFFGMGFSLGKSSARTAGDPLPPTAAAPNNGVRPAAARSTDSNPSPPADLTFYKTVGQKDGGAQLVPSSKSNTAPDAGTPPPESKAPAPDPMAAPPLNGYFVQVAAVSKQEDAEGLVEALKKKQYPAFATNTPADKLFHVQVGPFADIKDAELTRAKLVADGYNPILKK